MVPLVVMDHGVVSPFLYILVLFTYSSLEEMWQPFNSVYYFYTLSQYVKVKEFYGRVQMYW